MTVASQTSRVSYSGNGSTVLFAVPFYFLENGHLRVVLRSSAGVETIQIITTNYTVTGAGNPAGGSITMTLAPASGETLVIVRNVPVTQETDYQANDPFPAESHERALDKLTMIAQQSVEIETRSIKIPETETTNTVLPSSGSRANKLLGFTSGGGVAVSNSTITQVDAAVSSFINATGNNAASILYDPAGSGAQQTTVQAKLRETISVKDFGAVGDGVTDDTAAIVAARTAANDLAFVEFPYGTYKVTGTLEMPRYVNGNFIIDGNIKWSFKKEVIQQGQIYVTGTIDIDSVWFSRFYRLWCLGNFSIYSSLNFWGVYWNDFGMIRCGGTLIIDVDQGASVNQNNFGACFCNGGVHIRGTNTTGTREAHNNIWLSIDTTGANLAGGAHLLNDSNLNQTNTVINWYAEGSGSRAVIGNWNILADNVDSASPAFQAGRYNYRLGSRAQGRQSSYLPMPIQNASVGGDWGSLDGSGKPVDLSVNAGGSVVTLSSVSANAANSPDASTQGLQSVGGGTFRHFTISYKLTTSPRISGAAYVYQEGTPSDYSEILDAAGNVVMAGAVRYTSLGNGWYLARFGGEGGVIDVASGALTGQVRLYTTTSDALTAGDLRIMTSYFVTSDTISPIPSIKYGQIVGYSTAAPTGGTWKRGDICWNTTPSAGGTPGWVCVTAGTPGTWKAMANLAV